MNLYQFSSIVLNVKMKFRCYISREIEYNPVYRVYKVQVKWVAVSILFNTKMYRTVQLKVKV